jgi:phospholipid/cholesterol/gamma-HCH transport system substrate-binding protein
LPSLDALPAPKPVSGPTYRLHAVFRDALSLTVGARVKQNGVVVGDVTSISTKDYQAFVTMRITRKAPLPPGTTAQVRFTSPLGEDYIALTAPAAPHPGTLADGATLAVTSTSSAPTIEDTFAALSLLLNGGGLNQLGTIVGEVNKAVHGRTGTVRDTLEKLDEVVRSLDQHRDELDRVLSSVSSLGRRLAAERGTIDAALNDFPPALAVLASQIRSLDTLVVKVSRLGDRTAGVLARGQAALLADLDELRPSLDALVTTQGSFPSTMQSLIRFGQLIDRAVPGDYLNSMATINVLFDVDAVPVQRTQPGADTQDTIRALTGGGS